jgi:hypothetical protein
VNDVGYYIIRNIVVCTAPYCMACSIVCTVLKSRRIRWDKHVAWRGDMKYNLLGNVSEMATWKMNTT